MKRSSILGLDPDDFASVAVICAVLSVLAWFSGPLSASDLFAIAVTTFVVAVLLLAAGRGPKSTVRRDDGG